jgi:YD repeat-containing protein
VIEIDAPPRLEPESVRVAARPPALAPELVGQRQFQAFVETMPDGTRVLYGTDGSPIRQWDVDGSVVSFDAQGQPQTRATVDGGNHPSPAPASAATHPALVVDQPDGQGPPMGVTFPDGTRAVYQYQPDGGRVVQYSTGVVTTEDGAGHILTERLPDGTVFTSFDSSGRPIGGTTPGGQPLRVQQPTDAPADAAGVVDPGAQVVRQVTSDGTVFDGFDGQGRPTSGVSSDGARFTVTYDAKGDPFQQFADGGPARPLPGGQVVRQFTVDGTQFDGFDGQGRPTSGVSSDGARFTVTYDPKSDPSQQPPANRAAQPTPGGNALPPVAPDAGTQNNPTNAGAPTSGTLPDGTRYTITYDAKGDAFAHFADGTTVEFSPSGKVIRQVAPDGTVIDGFDGQGRPTSGTLPDGTHFTTTYDAQGDTYQHFGDGTTVEYDPHGNPLKTWTANGTEITWAVDLPALAHAAFRVGVEQQLIENAARSLYAAFTSVEGVWSGPAAESLPPLANAFQGVTDQLVALLGDAVNRMKTAYHNYVQAETTNTNNLQPGSGYGAPDPFGPPPPPAAPPPGAE